MQKKIYVLLMVQGLLCAVAHATVSSEKVTGVQFGPTAFFARQDSVDPEFFLGVSKIDTKQQQATTEIDNKTYALSSLSLSNGTAVLTPLAKQVGSVTEGETATATESLYGKTLDNMVLLDQKYPVVTVFDAQVETPSTTIFAEMDPDNGGSVSSITGLTDAAGTEIDQSIIALAASNNYIFAAVTEAGKELSESTNAGVAVIKYDPAAETPFEVWNAPDFFSEDTAKATKLNVSAEAALMAFAAEDEPSPITDALIGNHVAMHWDQDLQRLYLGLSDVKRDSAKNAGGVIAVLMGYVEKDKVLTDQDKAFKLRSVVSNPKKELFFGVDRVENKNVRDRILGFYADGTLKKPNAKNNGDDNISVQVPYIKTMHTSTDKYYLIINSSIIAAPQALLPGGMMVFDAQDSVYALPLIPQNDSANSGVLSAVDQTDGGIIKLDKDKKYASPSAFDEMPTSGLDAVKIGGSNPLSGANLTTLFVEGDTVYMGLAGGTKNADKGLFASTAYFNKDGYIRGWTPARRVMGSVKNVYGAGRDTGTGNYYFLSEDDSDGVTATRGYITQWGKSQGAMSGGDEKYSLSAVLEDVFEDEGNVFQAIPFGPNQTPGITYAMLAVLGFNKVVLVQTGEESGGNFVPTEKFTTSNIKKTDGTVDVVQNVFENADDALKKIAPLYCAEVADGNLYVGGYGGVASSSVASSSPLVSAGSFDSFDFGGGNEPVLKITRGQVEKDATVHFLSSKKLYSCKTDGTKISEVAVEKALDLIVAWNGMTDANGKSYGFIATGSGLKKVTITKAGTTLESVGNISGQIVQLQYLSSEKGGYQTVPGMLYALVWDKKISVDSTEKIDDAGATTRTFTRSISDNELAVQMYRFAVDKDGNVDLIDKFDEKIDKDKGPRPFLQLPDFRSGFYTDGSILLYTSPKTLDSADFVRIFPLSYSLSYSNVPADVLNDYSITENLETDSTNFYVGRSGVELATGKMLIPGDWGIRVNE
ncbi:MAG: hypothetical protein V1855_00800 [bacterium]